MKKVTEEWEIWDEEEEEAKKLVPLRFHGQIYIFEKKASKRTPVKKMWDYAIKLKKEFVPRKGKIYLLSKKEREEVYEFIDEQLRKRYIRLLKLPQLALIFFVEKKDSKKRIGQNYRYLNEWTIKNPLPLISDIVENIGIKKVFTKLDLQWGIIIYRSRRKISGKKCSQLQKSCLNLL